jgi:hypothetical protein
MPKFKYEKKTYTLRFATGDELDGLEVEVSSVPLGRFLRIMKVSAAAGGQASAESLAAIEELFDGFADALIRWNLTDEDDNDVPTTAEALHGLPTDLVMRLIQEWMQAIAGVSPELGKGSDSGVTYPAVPMQMAAA